MDTFGSFADKMPPVEDADKEKVMHAYLKGDKGIELMASDTPTGMQFQAGAQISLTLNGDDEDVLRDYWNKLSDGGQITLPLEASPWGTHLVC